MNITLFIGRTYGGGAERVTCNLANFLADRGHHVEILVMSESKCSYAISLMVAVVPLLRDCERWHKAFDVVRKYLRLRKYVRTQKDVGCYVVMLPKTILMLLSLHRLTKARIVASERCNPSVIPLWEKRLLRAWAKRADAWVFQTEDARAWYGKSVAQCRTYVIPNAVNPDFLTGSPIAKKQRRIVAAGRLVRQKNFPLLIEAFSSIAPEFPEWTLIIFGEGAERGRLQAEIEKHNLQYKIMLGGYKFFTSGICSVRAIRAFLRLRGDAERAFRGDGIGLAVYFH